MVIRIPELRQVALAAIVLVAVHHARAAGDDLPVDLELVLAVDVSRSIDNDERLLQRVGYVAALRHPELLAAIESGVYGRIAVIYVEWAGPTEQRVVAPWHLIDDRTSAEVAAAMLSGPPTLGLRGTSISGALLFASRLFDGNGFVGTRQVIDISISGDGPNNSGSSVIAARNFVVDRGIVINGLSVILKPGGPGSLDAHQLERYFEDCVIGGTGAFVVSVDSRKRLVETIERKLIREIARAEAGTIQAQMIERASTKDCEIDEIPPRQWRAPPSINDHPYGGPSLAHTGARSIEG